MLKFYPYSLHNMGADFILPKGRMLPEAPPYYEKKVLAEEVLIFCLEIKRRSCYNIKRGALFLYRRTKEAEDIIRIRANIMVSRDSQKGFYRILVRKSKIWALLPE